MKDLIEINRCEGRRSLTITASSIQSRRTAPMVLRQLDERMAEATDDGNPDRLEAVKIDFARVDRIASEGINALIRVNRTAHLYNVPVVLCNVATRIREVLRMTRVDRVVSFEDEPTVPLDFVEHSVA